MSGTVTAFALLALVEVCPVDPLNIVAPFLV